MLIPVIFGRSAPHMVHASRVATGDRALDRLWGLRFAWTAAVEVAATHQDTNLDRNAGANGRSRELAPQTLLTRKL